jgi:tetratricopeptide (TPR) repeat protein
MQDRAGAEAYVPQVAKIPQYRAAMAGPSVSANRLRQLPQGHNKRAIPIANSIASDAASDAADDREPDIAPQSLTPSQTATAMPVPMETASMPTTKQPQRSASSPDHNSAAVKLAAMAHQWSETAKSEEDFTKIIETCRRVQASNGPDWLTSYVKQLAGWSLNKRGQIKAEAGFVKEALLDFDDAVRADATCWRAIHNRGVLLAQDGHFEKAFDDFNRTIELSPEFAKAYSNRGALYVVANDLTAALADYARAIELEPNLAIAHRGRGRVCHLLGQLDEAIGHYDAAVQLAPEDGYAAASRADLLTDLGRYTNAMADYNRAIEIDPHSAHAYSGSAWLLATCPDDSVRNPELAIERARMAIELSGRQDAVSFDTLAAAQASAGDFTLAAQTVRQAIDLAAADEREIYRDRLMLYQHAQPYRIAPLREVTQVSYEE